MLYAVLLITIHILLFEIYRYTYFIISLFEWLLNSYFVLWLVMFSLCSNTCREYKTFLTGFDIIIMKRISWFLIYSTYIYFKTLISISDFKLIFLLKHIKLNIVNTSTYISDVYENYNVSSFTFTGQFKWRIIVSTL